MPNVDYTIPYVTGGATITVDPKATNWRWAQRQLSSGKRNDLRSFDFGGPFISNRITYFPPTEENLSFEEQIWGGPLLLHEQTGPTWPCYYTYLKFRNPISTRQMPIGTEWGDLWALGGRYVAQTMPTVPELNLGTAAGEILLDGLPRKLGGSLKKSFSVRGAANEYLNTIFGWAPLLSDVHKLAAALPVMEDRLKQLVRDSGRPVRRRTKPRTATVDDSFSHWIAPYGGISPDASRVGECRHTVKRTVTTWFSASYVYNLPSDVEVSDKFQQIRYVLGLNVDAVTIWSLIPWSWLVDWVLPISPELQNLSIMARNQVRISRAYIMCQTEYSESVANGKYKSSMLMSTKQRDHASPWGFGLKDLNLSSSQLSILAALGLSRGHI